MVNAVTFGGTNAETGEPIRLLVMETPIREVGRKKRLSKRAIERLHLEQYRCDHLRTYGVVPFEDVQSGHDPPDFVVTTPKGLESIDCSSFTLAERRAAYDQFRRIREVVESESAKGKLPHLDGCDLLI